VCSADAFCDPVGEGQGMCAALRGACESSADCTAPDTCRDVGQRFERVASPLADLGGAARVFVSTGRCVEDLGQPCSAADDCGNGRFCRRGTCHREQGTCRTSTDCPGGTSCDRSGLIVAAVDDRDGDEIVDLFDNCPSVANVLQADADGDGVGDLCERSDACARAATPASIACRLAELADLVRRSAIPDRMRRRLERAVARAQAALGVTDVEPRKLRQAKRAIGAIVHQLRSLNARHRIDAATRAALLEIAVPMHEDLTTLLTSYSPR
jgi:hypothetical protein